MSVWTVTWASGGHHALRCPALPSRQPGKAAPSLPGPTVCPGGCCVSRTPWHLFPFAELGCIKYTSQAFEKCSPCRKVSCQPHCGPNVQPQDTCGVPSSCKGAGPGPWASLSLWGGLFLPTSCLPVPSPPFPNTPFPVSPKPVQSAPSPLLWGPAETAQGSSLTNLGHQPPQFQALPHATHSLAVSHRPSKGLTHPCVFLPMAAGFQDACFLLHWYFCLGPPDPSLA